MRVTMQRTGGVAYFPGLAKERTLDADRLAAPDRDTLAALVARARFFERPDPPQDTRGADRTSVVITIESGAKTRRLTILEPTDDRDLRDLIDFIDQRVK